MEIGEGNNNTGFLDNYSISSLNAEREDPTDQEFVLDELKTLLETRYNDPDDLTEDFKRFRETVNNYVEGIRRKYNNCDNIEECKSTEAKNVKSLKGLIRLLIEAMGDISRGECRCTCDVNARLSAYGRCLDQKLSRREIRASHAINILKEYVAEVESCIDINRQNIPIEVFTLLFKVKGIVDDIGGLSQKVGATRKEISISNELVNLVKCVQCLQPLDCTCVKCSIIEDCKSNRSRKPEKPCSSTSTYKQENDKDCSPSRPRSANEDAIKSDSVRSKSDDSYNPCGKGRRVRIESEDCFEKSKPKKQKLPNSKKFDDCRDSSRSASPNFPKTVRGFRSFRASGSPCSPFESNECSDDELITGLNDRDCYVPNWSDECGRGRSPSPITCISTPRRFTQPCSNDGSLDTSSDECVRETLRSRRKKCLETKRENYQNMCATLCSVATSTDDCFVEETLKCKESSEVILKSVDPCLSPLDECCSSDPVVEVDMCEAQAFTDSESMTRRRSRQPSRESSCCDEPRKLSRQQSRVSIKEEVKKNEPAAATEKKSVFNTKKWLFLLLLLGLSALLLAYFYLGSEVLTTLDPVVPFLRRQRKSAPPV